MVHHHLIGQVRPELSLMDPLVEQRLQKKNNKKFFFLFVTFIFMVEILTLCSMQSDFNNKDAGPQRLLVEKFHSYV